MSGVGVMKDKELQCDYEIETSHILGGIRTTEKKLQIGNGGIGEAKSCHFMSFDEYVSSLQIFGSQYSTVCDCHGL